MKNIFKQAHTLTKAMQEQNVSQGFKTDYKATFKLACQIIKERRFNEINTLVDVKVLFNVEVKENDTVSSVTVKTSTKKVAKKSTEKQAKKQAKKQVKEFEFMPKDTVFVMPSNIYNIEGVSVDEIIQITDFVKMRLTAQKTNKDGKVFQYGQGFEVSLYAEFLEELSKTNTRQKLQGVVLTYLLDLQAKSTIKKYLVNGLTYRTLEREKTIEESMERYSRHYVQIGDKKLLHNTINDVFGTLVYDSLRLDFKSLFTNFYYSEILMRVTNATRTLFNNEREKHVTNVSNIVKNAENETQAIENIMQDKQVETVKDREDQYISMIQKIDFLDNTEKQLLTLQLKGHSKKDIYKMMGRVDRKFQKMEEKICQYLGITKEQYKKMYMSTKRI